MKEKILYSNYDKNTGISKTIISNKYGVFTGISKLSKEDSDFASSYAGCRYSLYKAKIKSYKCQLKEIKFQLKTLRDFSIFMSQSKEYNKNSHEAKKLRQYIYLKNKEKNKIEEEIRKIESQLKHSIKERENTIKKIREKKVKRE